MCFGIRKALLPANGAEGKPPPHLLREMHAKPSPAKRKQSGKVISRLFPPRPLERQVFAHILSPGNDSRINLPLLGTQTGSQTEGSIAVLYER